MLQIQNISKQYRTGELIQRALDGVTLNLRDNEFVSILGPSGSGKTTLLNIIGGLDRYDSGDLVINGTSTKKYKDRDWDSYRNHTIGFVFQSYNLIPHQSILSNVELALTISGVSRGERKKRAKKALEEVGLGGQLHKKPNQLSGGQMQRVAIARALVNDPDILLADEPTGALDTETSLQVMDLLKDVAKDRLVVMVTHNPELAEQYSTRTVKLRDGKIIGDSNPFVPENPGKTQTRKTGRAKMSFGTSLSLSFNNLWTKKGRTLLTAFAGSIGIIGIALILALSTGVNAYISDIQREAMTSYPLTISAETLDLSGMADTHNAILEDAANHAASRSGVYADYREIETSEAILGSIKENNLSAFKKYLDDPDSEIRQYLGENGISYSYQVAFSAYSYDSQGNLIDTGAEIDESGSASSPEGLSFPNPMDNMRRMSAMMSGTPLSGAENFSQLMAGENGEPVSPILTDSYDVLYGSWPETYDEIVLVLDENNSIPAGVLYQLGLITAEKYDDIAQTIEDGGKAEELSWDYQEICGHVFYMVPACDHYLEQEDGTFTFVEDDSPEAEDLLDGAVQLKIVGVIRPKEDAANASLSTSLAYTSALTDYVIAHTDKSPVVLAQEKTPEVNVLSGMGFDAGSDEEKIEDAKQYISGLGISDKAALYTMALYVASENAEESGASKAPQAQGQLTPQQAAGAPGAAPMDETTMAAAMDRWLEETPDEEFLLSVYNESLGGGSYEENLKSFGKISYDVPNSISIYTDSFEDKESVSDCIQRYNESAGKENQIAYTDYVALLTSSITSMVNAISYVLIAFVAVSLIVSCIMIGIITHISVLERTKEIGILRALGASKRNISQVFNAETIIIGLCAGALGVGVSVLLTFPINSLIQSLLDASTLAASLSPAAAGLLVALSVLITVVGGLIPAKNAAKKDPVTALRTE